MKVPLFDRIRRECSDRVQNSGVVVINTEAIYLWVNHFFSKSKDFRSSVEHFLPVVPLRLETPDCMLSFHFLNALLRFGSGYNQMLLRIGDRTADEVILYGLLAVAMTPGSPPPTYGADHLASFSPADCSTIFSLDDTADVPLADDMQGIYTLGKTPLAPYLADIVRCIGDCARVLREGSASSPAAWIRHHLPLSLEDFVDRLGSKFLGFAGDVLYAKSITCVAAIAAWFAMAGSVGGPLDTNDYRWTRQDFNNLPASATSDLVEALLAESILVVKDPSVVQRLRTPRAFRASSEEEVVLRSAALIAVDTIVEVIRSRAAEHVDFDQKAVSPFFLGDYLRRTVTRDRSAEHAQAMRMICTDTLHY